MKSVPWDEVGTELGRKLIPEPDPLSKELKEIISSNDPGIPDFENRWRYEFCIWKMFWVWYVANSPKLEAAGATRSLLDAYHHACLEAMIEAGLLQRSEEAIRAWEDDLDERFMAYKARFENPPAGPVLFAGTMGWLFARYLFPGKQPNPKLMILINEMGSVIFRGLAKMIQNMEASYGETRIRKWMRRWNKIGIILLTWIPVIWSGFGNLGEQFGSGYGLPDSSWRDVFIRWGFWLVGVYVWIQIVRWFENSLKRKFSP
jgi:hypothetical protein